MPAAVINLCCGQKLLHRERCGCRIDLSLNLRDTGGVTLREIEECIALLPAAGQGLRMGGNRKKPYLYLADRPVIVHTLQACLRAAVFSRLIVVVAPGEEELFYKEICGTYFPGNKAITCAPGGLTRRESVFKGLKTLLPTVQSETIICVHDAVRPCVSPALLRRVVEAARDWGGAIAAVPLIDTVKVVDGENKIIATPQRDTLVAAQTPQCFKFSLLWEAHCRAADFPASDDALLVERLGQAVKVVPGSYLNIKLTTPYDLKLAEMFLTEGVEGEA